MSYLKTISFIRITIIYFILKYPLIFSFFFWWYSILYWRRVHYVEIYLLIFKSTHEKYDLSSMLYYIFMFDSDHNSFHRTNFEFSLILSIVFEQLFWIYSKYSYTQYRNKNLVYFSNNILSILWNNFYSLPIILK